MRSARRLMGRARESTSRRSGQAPKGGLGFEPTTPGAEIRESSAELGTQGITRRQRVGEMIQQQTKRVRRACPKSRRTSVGDQCRHTTRIVNQDVLVRRALC